MTTLTKDITAKFAVAAVAVAMIFAAFAPSAQAQTTEDLQQMINDLLAQVAQLQAQTGGTTGGGSASDVCPYTWTRDLTMGSEGADVMKLQQFLNDTPDLRVAPAGSPGSAGMETMYYGPATAAAVSKMQVMFRAEVLTPGGLVDPTGYFGSMSRAKANDLCVADATTEEVDEAEEGAEDEDEDMDEEDDFELGGSANLDTFEVDDADDVEIEEGDSDVAVGEFTVEFENGDAEISRLDIALLADGDSNTSTVEPWEAFESVSLWMDGDKIAEVNADDEDDYLDEDDGTLRFSNLDLVGMEDEEMVITVAVEVQNNLDSAELTLWNVYAVSMRYFDADGVAITEGNRDELQDDFSGDVATFDVLEAGENEELNFSLSSSNPDATDIVVDDTSRTNDVTIMEYTIEAEDNDIELNTLYVNIVTTGADYDDVVSDIELVIDGQTFRDEAVLTTTGSYNNRDVRVEFDIDGDITIDEDEEVEVSVVVDFKAQQSNYDNGDQIKAQVTSVERDLTDAEGADDVTDFSGTATGETHTLVAEGIVLPVDGVETSTDTQGDNDQTGIFTIEFEVTAVEGDFYITDDVFTTGDTATTGVYYTVDGPGTATTSGVLSSTGDEDTTDVFTVREGETETFTLTVTVDASATGQHRVTLTEVNYTDETDGVSGVGASYTPTPAQDFRTAYKNINAN